MRRHQQQEVLQRVARKQVENEERKRKLKDKPSRVWVLVDTAGIWPIQAYSSAKKARDEATANDLIIPYVPEKPKRDPWKCTVCGMRNRGNSCRSCGRNWQTGRARKKRVHAF